MFLRSGQHVQTFRESVQAGDHREIASTPESGLLGGLQRCEAHPVSEAKRHASNDATRRVFICRSSANLFVATGSPCIMKPVSAGRTPTLAGSWCPLRDSNPRPQD